MIKSQGIKLLEGNQKTVKYLEGKAIYKNKDKSKT